MKFSGKVLTLLAILILVPLFFVFDLHHTLSFENLKQQKETFSSYYSLYPVKTILLYMAVYILVTALSLPGAVPMTLLGGALFGIAAGTAVISFASTIGATLAFLVSRYLLRDWAQRRFADSLKQVNKGIEEEGAWYLFTMRLIPAIPFFAINLVMGLTPMKASTYYFISQIGMLAGTLVYVNAGTQLGNLESVSGIFTPEILISFFILGVFPLVARKTLARLKNQRKC